MRFSATLSRSDKSDILDVLGAMRVLTGSDVVRCAFARRRTAAQHGSDALEV